MPRRRPNPHQVKLHRIYSTSELAACCNVHKNTISNWCRMGLMPVDDRKPALFSGRAVRAFLDGQSKARKRPCPPAHLYCCRCREARPLALEVADYTPKRATSGLLVGLCAICGTAMHRLTREADLERLMPGVTIQKRPAPDCLSWAFWTRR